MSVKRMGYFLFFQTFKNGFGMVVKTSDILSHWKTLILSNTSPVYSVKCQKRVLSSIGIKRNGIKIQKYSLLLGCSTYLAKFIEFSIRAHLSITKFGLEIKGKWNIKYWRLDGKCGWIRSNSRFSKLQGHYIIYSVPGYFQLQRPS